MMFAMVEQNRGVVALLIVVRLWLKSKGIIHIRKVVSLLRFHKHSAILIAVLGTGVHSSD